MNGPECEITRLQWLVTGQLHQQNLNAPNNKDDRASSDDVDAQHIDNVSPANQLLWQRAREQI